MSCRAAGMVGADMIVGVDINPRRRELAEKFGMTHFVNPKEVAGRPRAVSGRSDQGRRRLQLRMHRQCADDAPGAGMLPSRLGGQRRSSASPASGQEISTRPFQLVTGRVWKGTAFGGARGRTDVPKIVDWYMEGEDQYRRSDHPHAAARRHQQGLRPDARGRVDPQRRRVLRAAGSPPAV